MIKKYFYLCDANQINTNMTNRRNFLKSISLLTMGGLTSQELLASNNSLSSMISSPEVSSVMGKKKIGLQTYSLGQELLKDIPNGLARLAKMGYTELEIFGYQEKTGKFGDYSPTNKLFVGAKEYKKMAADAGLTISSSHCSPFVREYTSETASQCEEFWKKAVDVHAELGVKYLVQPNLPSVENEDDAKRVADVFNRAGEIAKAAGIKWGYHNHNMEFIPVPAGSEKAEYGRNAWDTRRVKGTPIEELFIKNTDPDKVMFELDVYWTVMGQNDPVEWMEKYPDRIKLLHIKDRWALGASGMMNFENIFKTAYKNNLLAFFVELEGDPKGRTQFEGVELSAKYLQAASFVK